ncbi:spliceosome-associated protein CWC27 homolog [Nycticebus coucang]|uniref:spliceosome-associated protein CWC27 homolog n=1 Tax=Nycticebus coucang TaxID=9470 RepID=UPI00234E1C97|nr:spliceosome-associated protein CWC27 homolog [Nycticebus coucang]
MHLVVVTNPLGGDIGDADQHEHYEPLSAPGRQLGLLCGHFNWEEKGSLKESNTRRNWHTGTGTCTGRHLRQATLAKKVSQHSEEVNRVSQSMKGKSKNSHDLLKDDPHLSSVPAVESEKGDTTGDLNDDGNENAKHGEYIDGDEKNLMRERIAKKLKKYTSANVKSAGEGDGEKKSVTRREELRKEARQLKWELLAAKQRRIDNAAKQGENRNEEKEATPDGALAEYRREKQKYEALRKQQTKKGTSREDQTLALLNQFKFKLTQEIAETPENDISKTEVEDDEGWMSHVLQFEDKSRKVKDASMQDSDTFEIYDPRNPVNKRRRE